MIVMFWKVVESFTDKQKRQLLKFATSCSRPPLLGFKVCSFNNFYFTNLFASFFHMSYMSYMHVLCIHILYMHILCTHVVRHGRLRWFGHVESKNGDDWVSACRNVVVAGVRCVGRGRKTWR